MNILKYLRKNGFDTLDTSFYSKIEEWESWYQADVPKFHRYRVYRGSGSYVRCRRLSLKMAKKLSEDIADLLLNERVKITIGALSKDEMGKAHKSDSKTEEFVKHVLANNNFLIMGNEYQERKAYSGTVAYVPYIRNMAVDASGRAVSGEIDINYVSAKNIYPLSWNNGRISEVAFAFPKVYLRDKYVHLEMHRQNRDGTYYIENHVIKVSKSDYGDELDSAAWNEIPIFAGLAPKLETGSAEPQFVIDRLNIVNNADEDETNPMGIAIFANAEDVLESIDLKYDSYANEFKLGRKRIFVAPEMLTTKDGDVVFDENDTVFYQLPEDYAAQMQNEPIKESNMSLRIEEHSKAINDDLNMLSLKCGFGTERYRFDRGSVQTATQVISENSDMFRMIKKHEIILEDVIRQLVSIIIRLGNTLGAGLNEAVEVAIDFDDSIIEDKQAERQSDRQEVSMGVMSLAEYRAKWYGETEDVAKSRLPEQQSEVME